jgi:hypothetical protein
MNIIKAKKSITMLVGIMAIAALGSIAQAETRLAVQDSTGTTDKMVVTDGGKIGVGNANPDSAIYVKAPAVTANPAPTWLDAAIKVEGNQTTNGAGFLGYNVRAGAFPLANDRLGYFLFGSYNGTSPLHAAGVTAGAEANWSASSTPTYFSFATTPTNSTTRTERLRITAAGNVGINATAPTQVLEVNGGIRINTTTSKPVCDASNTRGTFWFTKGATGVADTLELCTKDTSENYGWRKIY